MKNAFEHVPASLADPNETDEIWTKKRSAYTTTKKEQSKPAKKE